MTLDSRPKSYSIPSMLLIYGLPVLVIVGVLYLVSLSNYLLFHSLVELFSVAVGAAVFMLAWHTRRFMDNDFLFFIGISYLFAGIFDLLHTLAYKGMGLFPGDDANLPTQLWIAARYFQSISFLFAAIFYSRRFNSLRIFLGFAVVATLLMTSIALGIFPDCYVDGLTPFKKISEYIISLIFAGGILWLKRRKYDFSPAILNFIVLSILFTILAELAFTFYVNVYGISNFLGHIFKVVAVYFVYKSIIETGLNQPLDLLFRDMKKREMELESSQKLLHELATHDLLTGLPNRRLFETHLSSSLTRASENTRPNHSQDHAVAFQVIILDLDDFKNVNDLLGHMGGDEVLKETARRLRAETRPDDMVARWGGDEFTCILEHVRSVEEAEIMAQKLIGALSAPMEIQGQSIAVTVSMGVSLFPQHGKHERDLMRCADAALYLAKGKKNRFHVYDESMQRPLAPRLQRKQNL